jgi:hypothetical protein
MKDKIRVQKASCREKATVPDATLFPDTRGPRAGVRRAVDVWNRARGGSARSLNAVASRVAVARAVASPRVPGFAFVRGMGAHAPASDDFIVILADALAGKNALLPATAPLLAAARPMRAAVTPRPEPDTARLAMDMQREADIVDVRCRWNGRRARSKRDQNPKTPPRDDKNEAPHAFLVSAHISKHFRRVTARSFRRPSAS